MLNECAWAHGDPLMQSYHDEEWGRPEYDCRALWEKLILDGFQAGLTWKIIIHRREAFREAFRGFCPEVIAKWDEKDVKRLIENPKIIRSRSKIESTIGNAKAYLAMKENGEDFSQFIWSFTDGKTILNDGIDIPAQTPLSQKISAELKKRGFKFAGPVIVYAYMQAIGLVNDHAPNCPYRTRIS